MGEMCGLGKLRIWLYTSVVSWTTLLCSGDITMDEPHKGSFTERNHIGVLLGTNVTFNYQSYPFDGVHRVSFFKLPDVPGGHEALYFTCVPNDTQKPCDVVFDRVSCTRGDLPYTHITLYDVTEDDVGTYRTRVINESKVVRPRLVDVETTLNVYREDDFTVTVHINNASDGFHTVPLKQTPYHPDTPISVLPDCTYTCNVTLSPTSSPATIHLTQWTGNHSKYTNCSGELECLVSFVFTSTGNADIRLQVEVDFHCQNVPNIMAELEIRELKNDPGPVTTDVTVTVAVAVGVVVMIIIILVVVLITVYKHRNRRGVNNTSVVEMPLLEKDADGRYNTRAILDQATETKKQKEVSRILSKITSRYEDVDVSAALTRNGCIQAVTELIKNNTKANIKCTCLEILSMVAINKETAFNLFDADVIQTICGCLADDSPSVVFQACYIMISIWPLAPPSLRKIGLNVIDYEERLNLAIDKLRNTRMRGISLRPIDRTNCERFHKSSIQLQNSFAELPFLNK